MRFMFVFFFKQKTAYEMRISDWSSDVCSSDLVEQALVAILKEIAKERGINMIINASRGQGVVLFADNSLVITDVAREKLDKRLPAVPLKADRKSTRLNSSH